MNHDQAKACLPEGDYTVEEHQDDLRLKAPVWVVMAGDRILAATSGFGGYRRQQECEAVADLLMCARDEQPPAPEPVELPATTPERPDDDTALDMLVEREQEIEQLKSDVEELRAEVARLESADVPVGDEDYRAALEQILGDEVTNVKKAKEIAAVALGEVGEAEEEWEDEGR